MLACLIGSQSGNNLSLVQDNEDGGTSQYGGIRECLEYCEHVSMSFAEMSNSPSNALLLARGMATPAVIGSL